MFCVFFFAGMKFAQKKTLRGIIFSIVVAFEP